MTKHHRRALALLLALVLANGLAACAKSGGTPAPAPAPTPAPDAAPAQAPAHATASALAGHDGSGLDGAGLVASDPRQAGTADIVRAGIRARLPDMRACYHGLRATQPTLAGTVVASFDIAPDGTVTQAVAQGVAPELEACVASTLKQIKFAIATDGAVHIKAYPIEFKP